MWPLVFSQVLSILQIQEIKYQKNKLNAFMDEDSIIYHDLLFQWFFKNLLLRDELLAFDINIDEDIFIDIAN